MLTDPRSAGPAAPAGRKPLSANGRWAAALSRTARLEAEPHRTLPHVVDELALRHGDAPALIDERETVSYRELAARQNRYARWALARGYGPGTTIGLFMPNRADYLAIWLGLSRTGATVALLNTNLAGASLAHCVGVADPVLAIVSADLVAAFRDAVPVPILVHGAEADGLPRIDREAEAFSGAPLAEGEAPEVALSDRALLIYTSGTTSLPKAANVSHHRIMSWSHWFAGLLDVTPEDRMYDCLPLYHSVGGIVATGATLVGGGAVILRERFSASRFWDDVVRHECTLFQYIGELCRFLVNAPPHPAERSHRLRLCVGNGLRPDIWERFRDRFAIPGIVEFYASTEGTVSLYNVDGKVGAVGRVPALLAHRSPAALVEIEPDGAIRRGPDGFAVRPAPGRPGELLGRAETRPAASASAQRFEGYTQAGESERKLVRDVFGPGDSWMRTGDLMTSDAGGFFYFLDRLGDTFRWKGENVATTEVAEALGRVPGIREAAVYGVAVPGFDGRAGMAALVTEPDFDAAGLAAILAPDLPAYAIPVFLRLRPALARTVTFKTLTQDLAAEGFDPALTGDPLLVLDARAGRYRPLDAEGRAAILRGERRL